MEEHEPIKWFEGGPLEMEETCLGEQGVRVGVSFTPDYDRIFEED